MPKPYKNQPSFKNFLVLMKINPKHTTRQVLTLTNPEYKKTGENGTK